MKSPLIYKYIKKLKLDNEKGLSNVLARECKFEEAVSKYNAYLDVLTSGSVVTNPSDLIGSTDFDELVKKAKYRYEWHFW